MPPEVSQQRASELVGPVFAARPACDGLTTNPLLPTSSPASYTAPAVADGIVPTSDDRRYAVNVKRRRKCPARRPSAVVEGRGAQPEVGFATAQLLADVRGVPFSVASTHVQAKPPLFRWIVRGPGSPAGDSVDSKSSMADS
eukprot:CAMPEP_0174851388 /NCGR_PEP_ID=MMETSP1114-20130205/23161_1 /TAXON_ID=312471 /ORGANISM="Neobodo designis, Strain CCAP 1951/1" /LENGTH=141 /DNA_ID=CAMNT_0016085923 /DNA_START=99 /DNA_END=524 /DNA_ORIENTATION=-